MRHIRPIPTPTQLEVAWTDPEPFSLVVQQTSDGQRITEAARQTLAERVAAEQSQPSLPNQQ